MNPQVSTQISTPINWKKVKLNDQWNLPQKKVSAYGMSSERMRTYPNSARVYQRPNFKSFVPFQRGILPSFMRSGLQRLEVEMISKWGFVRYLRLELQTSRKKSTISNLFPAKMSWYPLFIRASPDLWVYAYNRWKKT